MNTAQWLATDDGIEGAGDYRGYFIDKARLGERRRFSDGATLDWPLHMAEKSGVQFRDFKRAFFEAAERHRDHIREPFSRETLRQSFADALRHWRSDKIYARHCRKIEREWFPERSEIMLLNIHELDDVREEAVRRMSAEGWIPDYA